MAIIDQTNELGDLDGLETSLGEAVTASTTTDKPAAESSKDTSEAVIPDKFKGKSLEEVAESYVNLEKRFGQINQDLGTQRKLTDQLLDLKRADDLQQQVPTAPEVEISSTDLLDDPTGSVKKLVDQAQSKELNELREEINAIRLKDQFDAFTNKHTDAVDIANSNEFHEWAQQSDYRQKLLEEARQHDYSSADTLLTEYKLAQAGGASHANSADSSESDSPIDAAKAATLESAGASDGGGSAGGKTYRRADLMRLRIEKPDLYRDPAYQAEIMKAYAEGRVK